MTDNITSVLEQYKQAQNTVNELRTQLAALFVATESLDDRFKLVLELGADFLNEECYYTGRDLKFANGRRLSMLDDLYWERHETLQLESLYEALIEEGDFEWVEGMSERDFIALNYTTFLHQDTAAAIVIRDFLSKGLKSGTFDW